MFAQLVNQIGTTGNDAGLRPAQQFVPREHHQINACIKNIAHDRFIGQPIGRQVNQNTAAQILHQDHTLFGCQPGQISARRGGGKTDDAEIAGVALEQNSRIAINCIGVIAQAGFVGGTDFFQRRTALCDHVRKTERTADFDQFATGCDDFATCGSARQSKHHRRRAVVDDQCGFGTCEFANQRCGVVVTRPAFARGQIQLQVRRSCPDVMHRAQRFGCQTGTAKVGMYDDTGCVYNRA